MHDDGWTIQGSLDLITLLYFRERELINGKIADVINNRSIDTILRVHLTILCNQRMSAVLTKQVIFGTILIGRGLKKMFKISDLYCLPNYAQTHFSRSTATWLGLVQGSRQLLQTYIFGALCSSWEEQKFWCFQRF